jgi:hypothetical protein
MKIGFPEGQFQLFWAQKPFPGVHSTGPGPENSEF